MLSMTSFLYFENMNGESELFDVRGSIIHRHALYRRSFDKVELVMNAYVSQV